MTETTRLLSCLPEKEHQRLDHFISRLLSGVSRRDAKRACEAGNIALNGRRAAPGQTVQSRDILSILALLSPVRARPELFLEKKHNVEDYLSVIYEDEHVLLVDKRADVHSVTLTMDDPPTLADALAAYDSGCSAASPDLREAGLVQRLDYPTRGLILAAKSAEVWTALRAQFDQQLVRKTYLALAEGIVSWDNHSLSGDLIARGERMWVEAGETPAGEVSIVWRCEASRASLLRVSSHRGQRHQVRAHLAHLGVPLMGDVLYGSTREFNADRFGIDDDSDFFLLASELEFQHPQTRKHLTFFTEERSPVAPGE